MKKILFSVLYVLVGLGAYAQNYVKETVFYRDTLKMDIYTRPDIPVEGVRPAFIWSFGGGWESGDRGIDPSKGVYKMMLDEGMVVVAIDYRLGVLEARKNGAMADASISETDSREMWNDTSVATAIRRAIRMAVEDLYDATSCLVSRAEVWSIDTSKIIIGGGSAGAINSINAEYLLCNGDELARKHLPEGFRYAGVIGGACSVWIDGMGELQWASKPCPVAMFHGSADPTVKYGYLDLDKADCRMAGADIISRSLREQQVPYLLYTGKEYDHVLSGIPFESYGYEIMGFIHRVILGGEKLAIEVGETDYRGPKNLIRYFMESMGMSEEQVRAAIADALAAQEARSKGLEMMEHRK
ncbi:MAG: alpha/beta hydrolase [Bacteroidales bacterium]|nr:alpha/beta hydrolase [Bacteroidales bacterium]